MNIDLEYENESMVLTWVWANLGTIPFMVLTWV